MSDKTDFQNYLSNSVAFTNKRFLDLFLLINDQAEVVYKKLGIVFPVLVSSTVLYLSMNKQGTLTEIAKGLGLSHQLVSQRVKILLKLALIEKRALESDKRKTLYVLSPEGVKQSQLLDHYCEEAKSVFDGISEEVGVDLQLLMNRAIIALHEKSFSDRYNYDK